MSRELPEFPNLEHLRKQAKERLSQLQHTNPQARLTEAQHVLAREYGFETWAKLKAHVVARPRQPAAPSFPGNFARYSDPARQAIFLARFWAARHPSTSGRIEPHHLLLGCLEADPKLAACFPSQASRAAGSWALPPSAPIPLSDSASGVLRRAVEEADRLRQQDVRPGHIVLGMMDGGDVPPAINVLFEILSAGPWSDLREKVLKVCS
jgi:hypothetical protein